MFFNFQSTNNFEQFLVQQVSWTVINKQSTNYFWQVDAKMESLDSYL
jgi:hypothetical protein